MAVWVWTFGFWAFHGWAFRCCGLWGLSSVSGSSGAGPLWPGPPGTSASGGWGFVAGFCGEAGPEPGPLKFRPPKGRCSKGQRPGPKGQAPQAPAPEALTPKPQATQRPGPPKTQTPKANTRRPAPTARPKSPRPVYLQASSFLSTPMRFLLATYSEDYFCWQPHAVPHQA